MARKRHPFEQLYVHFITFSCYHRRRILEYDQANRVVLGCLNNCLKQYRAKCLGFVLMPNHIHALIWFEQSNQLHGFVQQWKHDSSHGVKEQYQRWNWNYGESMKEGSPIWQRRYYSFEIFGELKIKEKLRYMHMNSVRANLVETAPAWRWSSARWYEHGKSVGVPITMPDH